MQLPASYSVTTRSSCLTQQLQLQPLLRGHAPAKLSPRCDRRCAGRASTRSRAAAGPSDKPENFQQLDSDLESQELHTEDAAAPAPLRDQDLHVGAAASRSFPAGLPKPSKPTALGLGLLAAAGVAFGLVSLWKRNKASQQQISRPAPPSKRPNSQPPPQLQSVQSATPQQTISSDKPSKTRQSVPSATPEFINQKRKQIICRDFAADGKCWYGDSCRYSHDVVPETQRKESSMQSPSTLTTEGGADSASASGTESDTDDSPPSGYGRSQPSKKPFSRIDPSGLPRRYSHLKVQKVYSLPADEVKDVGKLIGYHGRRINQITTATGCRIMVPKTRPTDEALQIKIYAADQAAADEAHKLVSECFIEPS